MEQLGKIIIIIAVILLIIGVIFYFSGKLPFLGKLPGDIVIEKENFKFYFPLGTSILISLFLSLIFYIIGKFR
ncbi:MAG: DUF2905 domain-containing protein [Spirochaetia bacterium]|nr:DUF2905 domain-containing protein [Spirochaetia bacterium]